MRGNKAFTLAEVLITLVIIGVIGALTVPSLIQNTKKQEYVSALKKAYSTLSQAAQMIISEEGSPKCDAGGWACSVDDVYNMYKKYLNNAKDCGAEAGCFIQGTYTLLTGGKDSSNWNTVTTKRSLILADGMQILFSPWVFSKTCAASTHGSANMCTEIHVDINGVKGPNIVGRDVFSFALKDTGLFPRGCDSTSCVNTSGWGCACKVLSEGAINY